VATDAPTRRRTGGGAPAVLGVPALLAVVLLLLPLVAVLVRAPWRGLGRILTDEQALQALRISIVSATAATVLSVVLGVPLAWVLARTRIPGLAVLRALLTLPLVLPPVVAGVALLLALGRAGVLGRLLLHWFGFALPFTTPGVVVAETFVSMPFLVLTVEGALRSSDVGLEEAAATLGASRLTVFRRVTLPLVAPSVLAGSVLCWARALGEFGATITFAGSVPGITQTMPIYIYFAMQNDPQVGVALSLLMVALAVLVLGVLRERWLRTPGSR
jgi:molybdate transport system permease protein